MRRHYWISSAMIAATLLILGLVFNISPKNNEQQQPASLPYVTTLTINRGDWAPMHRLPGQIQAEQQLNITSQITSKVQHIHVQNGQSVSKGDLIVSFDDRLAQSELQRLNAQQQEALASEQIQQQQQQLDLKLLALDQQQLNNTKTNLQRETALLNKKLSTNNRIEQAQAEVARAQQAVLMRKNSIANHGAEKQQSQARLQQLELSMRNAQQQLEQHQLRAEFSGKIANLTLQLKQQVSMGQPLFSLFEDSTLFFHTQVGQTLAQQPQPQLYFQQQLHPLAHQNPWLESGSAAQKVVFKLNNTQALINSYHYAYWVSPVIKDSFLLSKRALFDFERVYYLQANTPINAAADPQSQGVFELVEINVTLHGYTFFEGAEYYIASASDLPKQALLLTSKIDPLYSGLQVTNSLPKSVKVNTQAADLTPSTAEQ